ncbi:MAG: hypothetical protein ACK55I_41215, partial [bacterium]
MRGHCTDRNGSNDFIDTVEGIWKLHPIGADGIELIGEGNYAQVVISPNRLSGSKVHDVVIVRINHKWSDESVVPRS